MADPAVPIPPSPKDGKKGGFLKNLNPKQKRIAAVVGVGALLAVIFLIARRKSAPEEEGQTPSDSSEAEGASGIVPGSGGATDPSAFLGEFSERQNEALERFGEQIGESLNRIEVGNEGSASPSSSGDLIGAAIAPSGAAAAVGGKKHAAAAAQGKHPGKNQRNAGGSNSGGTSASGGAAHPAGKSSSSGSAKKLPPVKLANKKAVAGPGARPAAPRAPAAPAPVAGPSGGVAQVGGAGGASGGVVHPNAYSSGIGAGHPKPAPPAGYHTYQGANGQWWFAPN